MALSLWLNHSNPISISILIINSKGTTCFYYSKQPLIRKQNIFIIWCNSLTSHSLCPWKLSWLSFLTAMTIPVPGLAELKSLFIKPSFEHTTKAPFSQYTIWSKVSSSILELSEAEILQIRRMQYLIFSPWRDSLPFSTGSWIYGRPRRP